MIIIKLITPPIEDITVRNRQLKNFPVNICLVTGVEKTTYRISSDGWWLVEEPVIKFHGTEIVWHFGEGNVLDRDTCYEQLVSKYGEEKANKIDEDVPCFSVNDIYSIIRMINPATTGLDNKSFLREKVIALAKKKQHDSTRV